MAVRCGPWNLEGELAEGSFGGELSSTTHLLYPLPLPFFDHGWHGTTPRAWSVAHVQPASAAEPDQAGSGRVQGGVPAAVEPVSPRSPSPSASSFAPFGADPHTGFRLLVLCSYESMRQLFEMNPDEEGERFRDVLGFIAQVSPSSRPLPTPLALPNFVP